jgi:hypothetical protein
VNPTPAYHIAQNESLNDTKEQEFFRCGVGEEADPHAPISTQRQLPRLASGAQSS